MESPKTPTSPSETLTFEQRFAAWAKILGEVEPLIGRYFTDSDGKSYHFFGLVDGGDDYYYGMSCQDKTLCLYSCVGSFETYGLTVVARLKP